MCSGLEVGPSRKAPASTFRVADLRGSRQKKRMSFGCVAANRSQRIRTEFGLPRSLYRFPHAAESRCRYLVRPSG